MELKQVSPIHTSCHNCAFAQYEINDNKTGLTQVGCSMDQLSGFQDKELCSNGANDEFYIIDNELCLYKRNPAWATKYKDYEAQIKLEMDSLACKLTCILLIQDDCQESDILSFIDKMLLQTYKPYNIIVCITAKNTPKRSWLVKTFNEKLNMPWSINSHNKNVLDLIEDSVKDLPTLYYSVFNINDDIKVDYFEKLNEAIKNNKKFFAIEPINDRYSYLSIMMMAHKVFGGNNKATLSEAYGDPVSVDFVLDKIKVVCNDKQKMEFIKTNEEIGILS